MRSKKVVTGVVLAAGSLAGSVLVRRRAARRVDHVDLYANDGSMVSVAEGDADADRMLDVARRVLAPQ